MCCLQCLLYFDMCSMSHFHYGEDEETKEAPCCFLLFLLSTTYLLYSFIYLLICLSASPYNRTWHYMTIQNTGESQLSAISADEDRQRAKKMVIKATAATLLHGTIPPLRDILVKLSLFHVRMCHTRTSHEGALLSGSHWGSQVEPLRALDITEAKLESILERD